MRLASIALWQFIVDAGSIVDDDETLRLKSGRDKYAEGLRELWMRGSNIDDGWKTLYDHQEHAP